MPEVRYNREAVEQQIAAHNRRYPGKMRIRGSERRVLHAVLKGRQKEDS
jgi:hypothetical protein